jgi:uncharacterized membrane protein
MAVADASPETYTDPAEKNKAAVAAAAAAAPVVLTCNPDLAGICHGTSIYAGPTSLLFLLWSFHRAASGGRRKSHRRLWQLPP